MQFESMIKLIGRRPVYRVDRIVAPASGEAVEARAGCENGAPVVDQDQRYRFMSGTEDGESDPNGR